ncbi:MAG: N-acetyltransferase [Actinomycetes bacterium]
MTDVQGHHPVGTAPATIRVMRPDEFPAVRALSAHAFDDPTIATLLDLLRESWAWSAELSFVAEADGELVGHVLYTRAFLDAPARLVDVLVLSPLAVRLDQRGRGVGSQLVRESLARLGRRDEPLVFLEGHPGFYPRLGFERAHDAGFTAPSARIPADAFMVHRLPSFQPWMTGSLVYPDAFWRVDAVGLRGEQPGQSDVSAPRSPSSSRSRH